MPKRQRERSPRTAVSSNTEYDANVHARPSDTSAVGDEAQDADLVRAGAARRRPTACTACRRQKLKCEMAGSGPPCTRCTRRGFTCLLDGRSQALVEDQRQTALLRRDLQNMHESLRQVCRRLNAEPPPSLLSLAGPRPFAQPQTILAETENDEDSNSNGEESPILYTPYAVHAPVDSFIDNLDPGRRASASTGEHPRERRASRHHQPQRQARAGDIISPGLITMQEAEVLVQRYFNHLDPSLYGIAARYKSLDDIRQASPALLTAICTVSALHDPDDDRLYDICHGEFRRVFAASLFSEEGSVEYIRALCIASFWLLDDSRMLMSDAVRRCADMRLHGYFYQVTRGNGDGIADAGPDHGVSQEDARDRTRLWYMIFICDYHLSILDNRDGLLRHDKGVLEDWDAYLGSDGAGDLDRRIMSQVSLLGILNDIRDTFGGDGPLEPLHKSRVVQLNHFTQQLDSWWQRITAIYNTDSHVGEFPKAGVDLHLHFGKLYLGHHVFRGLSSSSPIPRHFLFAANMAHTAARSVFSMILSNAHLRASLVGRPHYVFIMISFAGHVLLEVCEKYAEQLPSPGIDVAETLEFMESALTLLGTVSVIARHPLRRMALGLRRKVAACTARLQRGLTSQPHNYSNGDVDTHENGVSSASLGQKTPTMRNERHPVQGLHSGPGSEMLPEMDFAAMGQMAGEMEQELYLDYDVFDNFPDIDMNSFV